MAARPQIPSSLVKLFLTRQLTVKSSVKSLQTVSNVSARGCLSSLSNYFKFNRNGGFMVWALAVGGGGASFALAPFIQTVEAEAKPDAPAKLIQDADKLYSLNQFKDLYALLAPHKDLANDEILWRLGRATYERAKEAGSNNNTALRAQLLRESFSYVEHALAINKENFAVHKWMAIVLSDVAALDGTKARIQKSYDVKDHMEKACKLNPTDGTSWHLLGQWHFNVANISWYERKAAGVLFANPPESTFQHALDNFLHAEKVEPQFYSQNLLMIGKCYERLKERDNAIQYLREALKCAQNVSQPTRDDLQAIMEAGQLLEKFGVQ